MTDIFDSPRNKGNISVSEILGGLDRLRLSALTNAAEISPLVKEVTIGPNSPINKEKFRENLPVYDKPKEEEKEEALLKDKIGEDLKYSRKVQDLQNQLQEESETLFKDLLERMIANRTETMRRYWKKQTEESERKAIELRAKKLRMLKDLQDNDSLSILERSKLHEQNCLQINKQTIENMNKILEEQNRATARFASITDSHTKICICYNEVINMLQTHDKSNVIADKYNGSLNSVIGNINAILDLCKMGTITDKDVKQAELFVSVIHNIKNKILEEMEAEKLHQENLRRNEEEKLKQKIIEEQRAQIKTKTQEELQKKNENLTKKSEVIFFSNRNYSYFEELKLFLENYERQYKDLLENSNLKKFRFDCQKAVNTPVNAISSVSSMHMKDKYDKLSKLLRGERVQVLDTYVQATQHPQGLPYVTALLAKKIVKQGDLLVSSNPEAAFPLASVTVALWAQFPELGKLLEAYFHRECPYLVPMFLPQKEGQSDKEFYLSRGYTYNDEGVVERQDKFLKRMSGVFRLRCAIWISQTPKFLNMQNPHGLGYGWQWLASFLNLKPEPDICATLLHDFFTVCGSQCFKYYRRQFTKVIKLICYEYFKILENFDEGGPKSRLEVFLQDVLKTGHIPPPNGILSSINW